MMDTPDYDLMVRLRESLALYSGWCKKLESGGTPEETDMYIAGMNFARACIRYYRKQLGVTNHDRPVEVK